MNEEIEQKYIDMMQDRIEQLAEIYYSKAELDDLEKKDPTYEVNQRGICRYDSETLEWIKRIVGTELAKRKLKDM